MVVPDEGRGWLIGVAPAERGIEVAWRDGTIIGRTSNARARHAIWEILGE